MFFPILATNSFKKPASIPYFRISGPYGMDAGFPTITSNVITFQITVPTTDVNFSWQEIGVFNNATLGSGTMFNRFLSAIGTKTNTQTWQLTVTLTVQAA
jgi:hypothetical protein